jgi:hypothetical protein
LASIFCMQATAGGDCCSANGDPGCNDDACEACVCLLDSFCCTTSWDSDCAGEALNECAPACACSGSNACNCCITTGLPGCDNPGCQTCVCVLDSFCCDVAWDGICAGEAQDECSEACTCCLGCNTLCTADVFPAGAGDGNIRSWRHG